LQVESLAWARPALSGLAVRNQTAGTLRTDYTALEVQVSHDEQAHTPVPAAMRPEDMLEDGQDTRIVNGIEIRKGTLGAFIVNARRVDTYPVGSTGRAEILDQLRALAPAVRALGLLEVFEPRGEVLRQVFAELESAQ
jgi:hypothetical protein